MKIQHTPRKHIAAETRQATCPIHGPFTSTLWQLDPPVQPLEHHKLDELWSCAPFWSRCPQCDAKMQAEADAGHEAITNMEAVKERAMFEQLRRAGVPPRFWESTVHNWQHGIDAQTRVYRRVRQWLDDIDQSVRFGRSITFVGATGCGKTHLAVGVLREVLRSGGTAAYTTAIDLLSRIKGTYSRDAKESEMQVISEFVDCDLLVIDEVGRQVGTDYDTAQLFRVIDKRSAERRPCIVISNYTAKQLQDFLGANVVDRLAENGGDMLSFDWASQRSRRKPRLEVVK